MNQFLNDQNRKYLLGIIGFGIPAVFILAQIIFGFGSVPLMVLMMSWFGIALLMFLGLSEE